MITYNLFDAILVKPISDGADKLYILSGYASPAIAYRHLNVNDAFSVELIIGMAKRDGIRTGSHKTFQKIALEDFKGRFSCYYSIADIPAHLKLYGWYADANPVQGFVGSANYSQPAFSASQLEAMEQCDASVVKQIFDTALTDSINCLGDDVENYINLYDERKIVTKKKKPDGTTDIIEVPGDIESYVSSVNISLLTGTGTVGDRSGLNWGQRPGRNTNQAYIPLSQAIRESDFFPPLGQHFIILTDDGVSLDCVRAQAGGKAVETFKDNSILGTYFRSRIGLPSGKKVTLSDFSNYGRSDVTMHKIDDETYYMDFSV